MALFDKLFREKTHQNEEQEPRQKPIGAPRKKAHDRPRHNADASGKQQARKHGWGSAEQPRRSPGREQEKIMRGARASSHPLCDCHHRDATESAAHGSSERGPPRMRDVLVALQ